MTKEEEILNFLSVNVFEPILISKKAPKELKSGVNLTITRLKQRDAKGMIDYFWAAIGGTEKSIKFSKLMEQEGFTRFEDIRQKFDERFNEKWLKSG